MKTHTEDTIDPRKVDRCVVKMNRVTDALRRDMISQEFAIREQAWLKKLYGFDRASGLPEDIREKLNQPSDDLKACIEYRKRTAPWRPMVEEQTGRKLMKKFSDRRTVTISNGLWWVINLWALVNILGILAVGAWLWLS